MSNDEYFGPLFSGDLRHLRHSNGQKTEELALTKVAHSLNAMKAQIYSELAQAGELGLTPDEFAEQHNKLINTVRRRFTDMWKDGFIRHHPQLLTRPNTDNNQCVVWVIGKDPKSTESTEKKIRKLRNQLKEHGITPCV